MPKSSPPPGDDDPDVFRRAVAGVRPLPARPARPSAPKPRPVARFTRAGGGDVLSESLVTAAEAAAGGGDTLRFRRSTVGEDVLRQLQRGRFALEAEIDLHGLVRHAAHDALRQFLADCVVRGLRCVRVIHGKGLRSGPGGPVLKHVVDLWLRRIDNVVAFASARPADGGSGAVYVLLAPRGGAQRRS